MHEGRTFFKHFGMPCLMVPGAFPSGVQADFWFFMLQDLGWALLRILAAC